MIKYILVREHETIEVLEGREERRDQLIRAGYKWVNKPVADAVSTKFVNTFVAKSKDEKPEG